MSQDITNVMRHFQECARTSWEMFFKPLKTTSDAPEEVWERFLEVERALFRSLVLWEIKQWRFEDFFGREPIPFIRVKPRAELQRCSVMISRSREDSPNGAWYWDDPVKFITDQEIDLRFIEYFDWDSENFRDYQYIRTRIISFDDHPDLVGRDALLEPLNIKMYFEPIAGV